MLVASYNLITDKTVVHRSASRKGRWLVQVHLSGVTKNGSEFKDSRAIRVVGTMQDVHKHAADQINQMFDPPTDDEVAELVSQGVIYDDGLQPETLTGGGFSVHTA